MQRKIYYVISPIRNIDLSVDNKHYKITTDCWGVVTDAYEKDYENYFVCVFPAKVSFIGESGKTIERVERRYIDLKQGEIKVLGWGRAPFEDDYQAKSAKMCIDFFEN
jgi:hypothetical protein